MPKFNTKLSIKLASLPINTYSRQQFAIQSNGEILMKFILQSLSALSLGLSTMAAFAAPKALITHNLTDKESNAYVAGAPSPYPTPAMKTKEIAWNYVRMACFGHATNDVCEAEVKMETDTSNPVLIGRVQMNLKTGEISPKILSANGYTIKVNGLAETTITKN